MTKIWWAVTRLTGAPYNYVEPFLKLMKGPAALQPALITNYSVFMGTLQDTFGIINADVAAEAKQRCWKARGLERPSLSFGMGIPQAKVERTLDEPSSASES
ncbi:hypothetical protein BGX20_005088 [Mortierella sp. AD010]|nr:hypothetical protein BGX20_005088 [Mortierella sp. AD010]